MSAPTAPAGPASASASYPGFAPERPDAAVREDRLIVDVARIVWRELPILLAVNVACALGAVAVYALAHVSWVLVFVGVPVVVGPLAVAAFGVADRLTAGRAAPLSFAFRLVWSRGLVGTRVLLVPAAVAGAAYAVLVWPAAPTTLRGGVLIGAGMLLTVAAVCLPAALSLGVSAGVSGVRRWRSALAVAAARPMLTLGGLAVGALFWVAVDTFGAGLLIALPGPYAVVGSALTWAAVDGLTPPTS